MDEQGKLAATAGTRTTGTGALLFSVATDRAHRRRGLGRGLVTHASRSTARLGAAHLGADVADELLHFYGRAGFHPYTRWRRYGRVHG